MAHANNAIIIPSDAGLKITAKPAAELVENTKTLTPIAKIAAVAIQTKMVLRVKLDSGTCASLALGNQNAKT